MRLLRVMFASEAGANTHETYDGMKFLASLFSYDSAGRILRVGLLSWVYHFALATFVWDGG